MEPEAKKETNVVVSIAHLKVGANIELCHTHGGSGYSSTAVPPGCHGLLQGVLATHIRTHPSCCVAALAAVGSARW